jgi:protein phosphatase
LRYAAVSDVGNVREVNEDYFYLDQAHNILFMVADGMGGHNAGDVASKMVINIIKNYFNDHFKHELSTDEIIELLKKAIEKANEEILKVSNEYENLYGMGTTIVCVFINNNEIVFLNAGDSRGYMIYDATLKQITVDHSLVSELLLNGKLTEDEAENHPKKNIITSCIGTNQHYKLDVYKMPLVQGAKVMLCTDGLTNLVKGKEMIEIINKNENDLQQTVTELVSTAKANGGFDNITIILIDPFLDRGE